MTECFNWDDIRIGDVVHAVNPRLNVTITAPISAVRTHGPQSMGLLRGSVIRATDEDWVVTMVTPVRRVPQKTGWYVSKTAIDAHGSGSSIRLYRRNRNGEWFRTVSTGDRGPWKSITEGSVPHDLVLLGDPE